MLSSSAPFFVKSCALAEIATGERVGSLLGLREKLLSVPIDCIYYHFWGGRLSPRFVDPDFHNDFAWWVHTGLHDTWLGEQLNSIDPTEYSCLEKLRADLVEIIEKRLSEFAVIPLADKDQLFHFVRSSLIVFDTSWQINHPKEIPHVFKEIPPSSFYYHFIDARTRTPDRSDDFSIYLSSYGEEYKHLVEKIKSIDSYFLSLSTLKKDLIRLLEDFFSSGKKRGKI